MWMYECYFKNSMSFNVSHSINAVRNCIKMIWGWEFRYIWLEIFLAEEVVKKISTHPSFEFTDDALATDDGVGLHFLQSHRQVLHFNFKRLLDGLDLDNTFLFLVQNFDGVLQFILYSLVSLIAHSQLLGHFFVVSGQSSQFLLEFCFRWSKIHADGGQLVDATNRLLVLLFDASLCTEGLWKYCYLCYLSSHREQSSG